MSRSKNAHAMRQVLSSFVEQQPTLFELNEEDLRGLPPRVAQAIAAKTAAIRAPAAMPAARSAAVAVPAPAASEPTATVDVVGFNHDSDARPSADAAAAGFAADPDEGADGRQTPPRDPTGFNPPRPRIKVFGVGGAGNNIVDEIARSAGPGGIPEYIEFWQLNTDAMHLATKTAPAHKMLLAVPGSDGGHGTGGDPLLGKAAADAGRDNLHAAVRGADVCVIVSGMGKGTGTGASPVLAKIARDGGALTLAFATLPALNEGKTAAARATSGLSQLAAAADAVCTIDNETALYGDSRGIGAAYAAVSREVGAAIKTVARLVLQTSYQNIDLADVRAFFRRKRAAKGFTVFRGTMSANASPDDASRAVAAAARKSLFEPRFRGAGELLVHVTAPQNAPARAIRAAVSAARGLTDNRDASVVSALAIGDSAAPIAFEVVAVREGNDLAAAAAADPVRYAPRPDPFAPESALPALPPAAALPPAGFSPRSARYSQTAYASPERTDGPELDAAAADYAMTGAEAEFDELLGTKKLPGDHDTDDVRRAITQRLRAAFGATAQTPDAPDAFGRRN